MLLTEKRRVSQNGQALLLDHCRVIPSYVQGRILSHREYIKLTRYTWAASSAHQQPGWILTDRWQQNVRDKLPISMSYFEFPREKYVKHV